MCAAVKNFEKLIMGVQSRSGSWMLINEKSRRQCLLRSCMSASICNPFHTRRANNGKV